MEKIKCIMDKSFCFRNFSAFVKGALQRPTLAHFRKCLQTILHVSVFFIVFFFF